LPPTARSETAMAASRPPPIPAPFVRHRPPIPPRPGPVPSVVPPVFTGPRPSATRAGSGRRGPTPRSPRRCPRAQAHGPQCHAPRPAIAAAQNPRGQGSAPRGVRWVPPLARGRGGPRRFRRPCTPDRRRPPSAPRTGSPVSWWASPVAPRAARRPGMVGAVHGAAGTAWASPASPTDASRPPPRAPTSVLRARPRDPGSPGGLRLRRAPTRARSAAPFPWPPRNRRRRRSR